MLPTVDTCIRVVCLCVRLLTTFLMRRRPPTRSSGEIEERAANEQRGACAVMPLRPGQQGKGLAPRLPYPTGPAQDAIAGCLVLSLLVWSRVGLVAWEDRRPRLAVQGDARVRSRSVLEVCGCLAFIRYGMASTFLLVVLLLSLETWDLSLIVVVSAFPASDIISKSFIKLCWYIQTITLSSHDGHVQRNAGECQSHVGHT